MLLLALLVKNFRSTKCITLMDRLEENLKSKYMLVFDETREKIGKRLSAVWAKMVLVPVAHSPFYNNVKILILEQCFFNYVVVVFFFFHVDFTSLPSRHLHAPS